MNNLSNLKIEEVSLCRKGMNPHAKVALFKGESVAFEPIAKFYSTYDPPRQAMDFKTILSENEKQTKLWRAREELYPLFDALNAAVSSIMTDKSLPDNQRLPNIEQTVYDFLSAVKQKFPDVDEELAKMFEGLTAGSSGDLNPDGDTMTDKIEDLKKSFDELSEKFTKAESELAFAKAYAELTDEMKEVYKKLPTDKEKKDFMDSSEDEKKKKVSDMKKADESFEFEGQKIVKSDVGEGAFAMLKSLHAKAEADRAELAKAQAEAELATLEKRASDDFGNLPGTDKEKASVLKAVSALDAKTKDYIEAVFKTANAGNKEAFTTFGTSETTVNKSDARAAKVAEIAKRDNVSEFVAMQKAVKEFPDLF